MLVTHMLFHAYFGSNVHKACFGCGHFYIVYSLDNANTKAKRLKSKGANLKSSDFARALKPHLCNTCK